MAAITPLGDVLVDPPEGKQQLYGHDKTYGEVRDGFDQIRDTCNKGIDKINGWLAQAGRSERLDRLTESSLDEYLVYPLSGNYYRIQQNGSACKILQQGMNTWASNFTALSKNSLTAFEGKAQISFVAQLTAYNLVMRAVGGVTSAGSVVFNSIAKFSERIAIKVEKVIVEMGKRLLRLSKVVAKRFLGGWASLALLLKDLAEHGLAVITDVVDDVKWCIDAIDACFDLKDEIEKWAQTQADRLEAFKEIAQLVTNLPTVTIGMPLNEVPPLPKGPLKDLLDGVTPDFGQTEEGEEAEASVDEAADGVVDDSGYQHPSWEEACVTPPPGMGHLPYDPALENAEADPFTGDLQGNMPLPIPGVSSQEYYDKYNEWRDSFLPPRALPPAAVGKPKGA